VNKRLFVAMSVFLLIFVLLHSVQAQPPQEILTQYISDIQKNPNDNALREKIIRHLQMMKQKPEIPEEARRYFIEGNALVKAAKGAAGYGLALDSYRQCLLIAPWWAEAYYNHAVALDLSEMYDEAITALKLYIAANPGGEEARKAKDRIYELGAKKKLAQQKDVSARGAATEKAVNPFDALLKRMAGRRYSYTLNWQGQNVTNIIDVRGNRYVFGYIDNINYPGQYRDSNFSVDITGVKTTTPWGNVGPWTTMKVRTTWEIINNGDEILAKREYSDGTTQTDLFR
jgi:tetratricopeptide (TPR) repeat protein